MTPRGIFRSSPIAGPIDPAYPGQRPIVLVTLATFSLRPARPVSAGNVMNVPPPAIALSAAATNEARKSREGIIGIVSRARHPDTRAEGYTRDGRPMRAAAHPGRA